MTTNELRLVTQEDSANMIKWRNLPEIRKYMYTDHLIKQEEHDKWFMGMLADTKGRCYLIYEIDGKPVGMAAFTEINRIHGTASWAYYIGEECPKGSGQLLEQLVLKYAFETLKLRKLCCEVIAFNEKVLHIHKKYGFSVEGILRKQIIKDEIEHDVVRLGIFKDEWQQRKGL